MHDQYVEIVRDRTGEVVQRMGPMSGSMAERVERGAMINLNHAEFHTRIVGEAEVKKGKKEVSRASR